MWNVAAWAQLSTIPPLVLLQLLPVLRRRDGYSVPRSERRRALARVTWWLQGEVARDWGTRAEWIGGTVWTLFLTLLALGGTRDYIQFTRRLGLVAVSQLPTCTLLAVRTHWSPFQQLLRVAHQELDPFHRVLGRVIIFFGALHSFLYIAFLTKTQRMARRVRDVEIVLGLFAVLALLHVGLLSSARVRRRSYRAFVGLHHALVLLLLLLLFFHVASTRLYVVESALVYGISAVARRRATTVVEAEVRPDAHPTVTSLSIPHRAGGLPPYPAGTYAYISRRHGTLRADLRAWFFANPFTAAVDAPRNHVGFHVKACGARTAAFQDLPETASLAVEGPYGTGLLHDFADALASGRVLLVAGGIGATFALSVAEALLSPGPVHPPLEAAGQRVRVVWVVRSPDDAAWGLGRLGAPKGETRGGPTLGDVTTVFVTGSAARRHALEDEEEDLTSLLGSEDPGVALEPQNKTEGGPAPLTRRGRPDLRALVDDFFASGSEADCMTVLSCGPASLRRDLRREVGRFVARGREVRWHEERFGQ